jgi:hypothetical protein
VQGCPEPCVVQGAFRSWNILDIFRQTEQNIFIPWVKEEISNDEEQHDDKKS